MALRTTLNAKNLEALGAQRLATLLIELSTGSAAAQRRLRLELAGASGSGDVAREVRKRLVSLSRSRSVVDWQKRTALVQDLRQFETDLAGTAAARPETRLRARAAGRELAETLAQHASYFGAASSGVRWA